MEADPNPRAEELRLAQAVRYYNAGWLEYHRFDSFGKYLQTIPAPSDCLLEGSGDSVLVLVDRRNSVGRALEILNARTQVEIVVSTLPQIRPSRFRPQAYWIRFSVQEVKLEELTTLANLIPVDALEILAAAFHAPALIDSQPLACFRTFQKEEKPLSRLTGLSRNEVGGISFRWLQLGDTAKIRLGCRQRLIWDGLK